MLKIVSSFRELDFPALMEIYIHSNQIAGRKRYPDKSEFEQLRLAEEDFCCFLIDVFFKTKGAVYALWTCPHGYVSALRLEPYRDGLLITGLETAPEVRCKGFATVLLQEVLLYAAKAGVKKVYSHVGKHNIASLRVHVKCGFQRIAENAVYLDGSVYSSSCTMCCEIT